MKKEIYRWTNKEGVICEYRFTDDICDGFFENDKETHPEYKGRSATTEWLTNLPSAGFVKVADTLPSLYEE